MNCHFALWRFGRAVGIWWYLERWGAMLVFIAWLLYAFMYKDVLGYVHIGALQLIDLLLGLPIVLAMGLVGAIIWMGVVRSFSCLFGQLREDDHASG